MNKLARLGFVLAILPIASCSSYNSTLATTVPQPQTPSSISVQDQKFIDQASSANMLEVESSTLALNRTRSPRTRTYAQTIMDDHTAAQQQLGQIAQANSVTLPSAMVTDDQGHYQTLNDTTRNFDGAYFREQTRAHQAAVDLYQSEISSGYNTDLRQFAQQTLPHLQQHLQMAQQDSRMPMRGGRRAMRSSAMPTE